MAFAPAPGAGYHVETKVALPDGGWDLASFDAASGRVYLARTDAVDALDVASNQVTKLAPATRGHAAIAINGGAEVLLTDGATDTARIFDAKSGQQVAAVPTGKSPDAALLDPSSGLALVMNAHGGDITLIDPKTHAAVGRIDVGGALELATSDGRGHVFLNVEDKNELVVLDVKARSAKHLPLAGCDGPTGIAYLPLSHRVLSACANGVAVVTDAVTLKPAGSLPIGKGPDTAMYDPVRRRALIPCGRSGDLWVFEDSAKGITPRGSVATQTGARTGALDPKTGRVYLPAADYGPPATPNGRAPIKPGSVVMVVLAP
jgi:DNA-binding beta-propeller fold protein YncE